MPVDEIPTIIRAGDAFYSGNCQLDNLIAKEILTGSSLVAVYCCGSIEIRKMVFDNQERYARMADFHAKMMSGVEIVETPLH